MTPRCRRCGWSRSWPRRRAGPRELQSPRYFGFVIGGGLESAIAADWLTSAWDQNAGGYPVSPSASVAEEVACEWLLDLLGLPATQGWV